MIFPVFAEYFLCGGDIALHYLCCVQILQTLLEQNNIFLTFSESQES